MCCVWVSPPAGLQWNAERTAVGVVLRRTPEAGENHLAVAVRVPAEDQPVRVPAAYYTHTPLSIAPGLKLLKEQEISHHSFQTLICSDLERQECTNVRM